MFDPIIGNNKIDFKTLSISIEKNQKVSSIFTGPLETVEPLFEKWQKFWRLAIVNWQKRQNHLTVSLQTTSTDEQDLLHSVFLNDDSKVWYS